MNQLHDAARAGSVEATAFILSQGSIGVNQGDPEGRTPLIIAAIRGCSSVVRVLLDSGANTSIEDKNGFTALTASAIQGHPAVTKMLVEAGADLEWATWSIATPLHRAAHEGHLAVMRVLLEAGANPDSRGPNGETPLFCAAFDGRVQVVRELLHGNADPLLTTIKQGFGVVPLDSASLEGHSDVVRELIQQVGIQGCGGSTGGVHSLTLAAQEGHTNIMGMLADVGVTDTCSALVSAAAGGHEGPVKFLLEQANKSKTPGEGEVAYVDTPNTYGQTPLLGGIESCSPRVVRLLIDAGADTTSAVRVAPPRGHVPFFDTPLAFIDLNHREIINEKCDREEDLYGLEAIRSLLLRVGAVHATSWLWPGNAPLSTRAPENTKTRRAKTGSTSLTVMLPILRRRATRRAVFLAALFRCVVSVSESFAFIHRSWLYRYLAAFHSVLPSKGYNLVFSNNTFKPPTTQKHWDFLCSLRFPLCIHPNSEKEGSKNRSVL